MAGHNDHEWVRGIKQKDPAILDDLWEFVYLRCLSLARRQGEDEQCATDVAEAAYDRITRKVDQYAFQCPFPGWCNRIIANEMNRWLVRNQRYLKRHILSNFEDDEMIGNASMETMKANSDTLRSRITSCLDELSERSRSIVMSLYFDWLSPEEVAIQNGLERGNINVIALRARRALLDCLQRHGFTSLDAVLSW